MVETSVIQTELKLGTPLAIVDLETTGSNTEADSITEIGIVFVDEQGQIETWSSLVNPQSLITPFVQSLTGITNEMVQDAPLFCELAQEIYDLLQGRLFIAHNVSFDYGVLSRAFLKEGLIFKSPRLCSVKASRALIKGLPSYSLGKLCVNLDIKLNNAHRALDDALATAGLMEKVLENSSQEAILDLAVELWRRDKLPDSVTMADVERLPNTCGVFRVYDKGQLIWVKAMKSISSEFFKVVQGKGPKYLLKELPFFETIEFEETGTFELARLIEMDQTMVYKPRVNRKTVRVSTVPPRPIKDQVLLGRGRAIKESSYMVVVDGSIRGYGYLDSNDTMSSFEDFEQSMQFFESALSFRAELENWIKNRKFRNIPRRQ